MNKRANTGPSIVILVILALMLTLAGLFIFYTSAKQNDLFIGNAVYVQKVTYEKSKADFSLKNIAESSFIDSYYELVSNGEFDNEKLREKYEQKLLLQIQSNKLNFEKYDELIKNIQDKKTRVYLDGDKFIFDSGEIAFTTFVGMKGKEVIFMNDLFKDANGIKGNLGVIYRTNITFNISAEQFGLSSLEKFPLKV